MVLIFSFIWIEFYMYALTSKNVLEMPFLYRTAFPFRLFIGPILFLYIKNILSPTSNFLKKNIWHLLLPTILVLMIVPDFLISNEVKRSYFEQFYRHESIFIKINTGFMPAGIMQPLTSIIAMFYCFLTIYYIDRKVKSYSSQYKIINRSSINWVRTITYVTTIFNGLQFVQFLLLKESETFNSVVQILQSSLLIFLKGHFITSPGNVQMQNICVPSNHDEINGQNTHKGLEKVGIPPYQTVGEFGLMIEKYMLERKPYLDSDFDLEKMSDDLKLNKRKISKYLKTITGMNFNDLVNRYRVYHYLELVKDNAYKSIKTESLIKECGFSHKSTFYASFQKIFGDSPSNYLSKDSETLSIEEITSA